MLTAEQLAKRATRLGSSDAAALFGFDPFKNSYDVWAQKTGRVTEQQETDAMARGKFLEPALLDWAQEQPEINCQLTRNVYYEDGDRCANLDAEFPGGIVEAKSTSAVEEYGDDRSDHVPRQTMIQIHHQLSIARNQARVFVPVILPVYGRFERRLMVIDADPSLRDFVAEKGIEFMDKYVKRDTPPPMVVPSLDTLKRFKRVDLKIVNIDTEIAEAFLKAKAQREQAEKLEEDAKAILLATMQDADQANYPGGRFTYFEQTVKEHVRRATTFRVLRHKAKKG